MQAAELWTSAVRKAEKAGLEGAGVWSGTGQVQAPSLQQHDEMRWDRFIILTYMAATRSAIRLSVYQRT